MPILRSLRSKTGTVPLALDVFRREPMERSPWVGLIESRSILARSGQSQQIGNRLFRGRSRLSDCVTARGRNYRSVSVKGTGLRYYSSGKSKSGCSILLMTLVAARRRRWCCRIQNFREQMT